MQSEESNTLVKLAKAVIEHAPEGGDAFWDIKFSDIEAALSAAEPVCCGKPVHEGSPEAYTLECCGKFVQSAPYVAVKELEWSPRNDQPQYEVCADTPFGRYKTSNKGEYGFGWMQPRQTVWSGFLPTLEEAKAAAQADYEARILSALSAQVQDAEEINEEMSLVVALDFADNPRPYHTLQAPADTNGELYRALRTIAAAYRSAQVQDAAGKVEVHYAYCCLGSTKYCDCVNKNHGTAWIGTNEVGNDYIPVPAAPAKQEDKS